MEKKNEILIFAVVLLGILVLILGGYIIYDKLVLGSEKTTETSKEETDVNEQQNEEQNKTVIENNLTIIPSKECSNGCVKTINTIDGQSNLHVTEKEIKLSDKDVLKLDDGSNRLFQVSVYNDIIIALHNSSLSFNMKIYDLSGKELKNINLFKDNQERMFYISSGYGENESFNVSSDGVISFIGTKHLQGVANTYLANSGEDIDLCTQGTNLSDDEIVSGIFKMSYLGKYNFSNVEIVNTKTTIKDIKSCN